MLAGKKMSCYNPMVGIWDGTYTQNGLKHYKIVDHYVHESDKYDPDRILIPCGKCIGCKLDYAREWSDRMILEFQVTKKALFCTLTYKPDELERLPLLGLNPLTGEVYHAFRKSDYQNFLKKIREDFRQHGIFLRYYLVGEYGEKNLRNHYHIIIFGCNMQDLKEIFNDRFEMHGQNEMHQPYWSSEYLASKWSVFRDKKEYNLGFVQVADATYETMNYVARYTLKKAQGDIRIDTFGMMPEFSAMSRRPGIGSTYAEKYKDKVLEESCFNINANKRVYWPKNVLEYALCDHMNVTLNFSNGKETVPIDFTLNLPRKEYFEAKRAREIQAHEAIENKMAQTGLTFDEQLKLELTTKQESAKILTRKDIKQNKESV